MRISLRKTTLAALLTAASIILDIMGKAIIPSEQFGLPLFALPLIVISIFLNPLYGLAAGFISDYVGFYLAPKGNYAIIFALSAAMWGFIPGIIANYKNKAYRVVIGIIMAHLFATAANTMALWIEISKGVAIAGLGLRLGMMPLNIIFLSVTTLILKDRLTPIYEIYLIN